LGEGIEAGEKVKEAEEKAFAEKRERFGSKRETGARGLPIRGGGLLSLRDLKVQALE